MSIHPIEAFFQECKERVESYPGSELARAAAAFMTASTVPKYSYNFSWLGRPDHPVSRKT